MAVKSVFDAWEEAQSTLLVMPTGTGKTICFAHIIKSAFPKRAMVLAHRAELIFQATEKIHDITGFRVDVEMADYRAEVNSLYGAPQVVVSTIQTQCAGGDGSGRMGKFDPAEFGILIIDEGHHSTSKTYRRVIDYYKQNPDLKILGVTATPDRADEEALGQVYDTVAFDYEILDAINDGWLVPIKQQMVEIGGLDFSKIRTTAGDLNGADLARVMEYEENLQGVVSATLDIVGQKKAIVFAASVDHAERMAEIFNRHRSGMADWVCGKTQKEERRYLLNRFKDGEVQMIVNVGILTEGFDDPGVECIIMARPTKSRSLYSQMIGRAFRPCEDIALELNDSTDRTALIANSSKPHCLVVDFAGNAGRHKLITTADILGGKISDVAICAAVQRAKAEGGPVDMSAILDEEERKAQLDALRRAKVVAKAEWAAKNIDPFGVLGVPKPKERGWDKSKKLTEKQHALLVKQGMDPDTLGYAASRRMIAELFDRWDKDLCSYKQARILRQRGYDVNVSRDKAKELITQISEKEGWKK